MNVYVFYFLLTLAIVIGFLIGFVFFLYSHKEKKSKSRKKLIVKQNIKSDEQNPIKESSLSNRFTDKGATYTDLVCETEHVETENYVENSRKKQNEAYTYTNRKK